jgi:50S ribosomal protein L16 3-hydroxylase
VPASLRAFAERSLRDALRNPAALDRALGQWLTEPKPQVWFEPASTRLHPDSGLRLDRRSRMMYDRRHVFLNGEAFMAAGRDARLMHRLADARMLSADDRRGLSAEARDLLNEWADAGWLHAE